MGFSVDPRASPGDPRAERVIRYFEALAPADLNRLGEVYADDVAFKDPFNDIVGLDGLRQVFEHMFRTLHRPRFQVTRALVDGDQAFLVWRFSFALRAGAAEMTIDGGSLLLFNTQGRVCLHRDYWDAAEELYAKLPVLGRLMRWLQARLRSTRH